MHKTKYFLDMFVKAHLLAYFNIKGLVYSTLKRYQNFPHPINREREREKRKGDRETYQKLMLIYHEYYFFTCYNIYI